MAERLAKLIASDSEHQVDPNWSPDGHKVVFAGNPSQSNSEIEIFEVGTGNDSLELAELARNVFAPMVAGWPIYRRALCGFIAADVV